jgi:23S rRNA G2445 N2-methylase RlmL
MSPGDTEREPRPPRPPRDARDRPPRVRLFAAASHGTEPAVRDELRALRFHAVRADRGGVHFEGSRPELVRALLELRTAVRVLVEVGRFRATSERELYDEVRALPLEEHLSPAHTLAVRATSRASRLSHTQFVAQKTKDAIVDRQRDRAGGRSSVDLDDPDVLLFVRLVSDEATVYLDASGGALHLRGYREGGGREAPLKETLAASLLVMAGVRPDEPFLDPMCGSGTLAIEAALRSRDVAPGLLHGSFGLARWASWTSDEAAKLREALGEARARVRTEGPTIFARDDDPGAVKLTQELAARARVELDVRCEPMERMQPLGPSGAVVTNPPYGERLHVDEALYGSLGRALLRMRGHRFGVLAGSESLARTMRLPVEVSRSVKNGALECRFVVGSI